jgi:hypothetical protein
MSFSVYLRDTPEDPAHFGEGFFWAVEGGALVIKVTGELQGVYRRVRAYSSAEWINVQEDDE